MKVVFISAPNKQLQKPPLVHIFVPPKIIKNHMQIKQQAPAKPHACYKQCKDVIFNGKTIDEQ